MRSTQDTNELVALGAQAFEHLERLRALRGHGAPPDAEALKTIVSVTRSLRGSASLMGLDAFQGFLGRLFQLLEDVESGELPWSTRLEGLIRGAEEAEAEFLGVLVGGEARRSAASLLQAEASLATWKRQSSGSQESRPVSTPVSNVVDDRAPGALHVELEATVLQLRRLRLVLDTPTLPSASLQGDFANLEHEIEALRERIQTQKTKNGSERERNPGGLQNNCEGGLRQLVDAAAQEVLDEARERGVRLVIRASGRLDPVEEELGAALLQILCNLWSDSLDAQAAGAPAKIDTVLQAQEQRLVLEVRDPVENGSGSEKDDDVLGRYAGLRRSRPLIESMQGLVWVEPSSASGCRFRVVLPLSTERPRASLVRVGQHEVALPSSAIEGVYEARAVRTGFDEAGAFAEIDGARVPILQLAFLLGDPSYDEMLREFVVLVGSVERRAALFVSGPLRKIEGPLQTPARSPWVGGVETKHGVFPLLHVGALLGRCAPSPETNEVSAEIEAAPIPQESPPVRGATVLVVDSSEVERESIKTILAEASCRVLAVQSAREAWSILEHESVDLLVCDLRLPEMNAQQVAEHRKQAVQWEAVPVLLVLSHASEQSHLVVQQLGANAFVRSPVEQEELVKIVTQLTD